MPDWLKYVIGVVITLAGGAFSLWAGGIKADTEKLVNQGETNKDRITVLETKFAGDRLVVSRIQDQVEIIAPQQIRIEAKIDAVLDAQSRQWEAIKEMRAHEHQR